MSQLFRAPSGGRIDRTRTLNFTFDGRSYRGHPGDTLASALLANGVRLVGRSFKYHRPRGILSAGSEEPNALVTVGEGAQAEPNSRATTVELYDGLVARSQNAWPSLRFDLGAFNSVIAPLLPAGFYYKTFLGSARTWTRLYEPFIRRMAGLGPAPELPDPDRYDKRHAHCDVLIVGAGPAGLTAALAAGRAGVRVILIDERPAPGGSLLDGIARLNGAPAAEWAASAVTDLEAMPEVRILARTTAFGVYDHGLVMAVERRADHLPIAMRAGRARQRLWQIRAKQILCATGAHEQPLVFPNNDLPGVMLASAGAAYAARYGVLPGRRIVIAGGNDAIYEAAETLMAAGADVAAIVDARPTGAPPRPGINSEVIADGFVLRAHGRRQIRGVDVRTGGGNRHIACDAILVSGGWQPAVHLHSHAGGRVAHDASLDCFVPVPGETAPASIGGCAGQFALAECLQAGAVAGARAATAVGFPVVAIGLPRMEDRPVTAAATVPPRPGASFVDYQNDVKLGDLDLAVREGFVSVEHQKRYTTTGMATDQGKLSNLNSIRRLGQNLGRTPGDVGTTTFRPPYTPVTFGTLAARDRGDLMDPARLTAMHSWHVAHGAVFEDVGQWKRPHYYRRAGETMQDAVRRECVAVRTGVGMLDASTLGKVDIQGPDAARFLNLVYTNAWSKLDVGRCRYGLMCKDDGMLFDDGVTARTGPDRFLMTTTTGGAARVLDHLEDYLQTEWPDIKVYLTSVTEHWAATVVTGPRARDVIAVIAEDIDLSNEAFPHLSMRECKVAGGVPARLYRISFTGELSYEVHVPAMYGLAVWEAIAAAGEPYDITPYGTETMHVLRAEKGYIIIGQETDGTVSPVDLGLSWAIAKSKPDFVGRRSLARPDMQRDDRKQLVGLLPLDGRTVLPEGAQITETPGGSTPVTMLGHVTSSYWSETLGAPFALALVAGGRCLLDDQVHARYGESAVACKVTAPIFYDVAGERMHG